MELEAITVLSLFKHGRVTLFKSPGAFFESIDMAGPPCCAHIIVDPRPALPATLPPQLERWATAIGLATYVVRLDLAEASDVLRHGVLRHFRRCRDGTPLASLDDPGRRGFQVSNLLESLGDTDDATEAFLSEKYLVKPLAELDDAAQQLRVLGALLLLGEPDLLMLKHPADHVSNMWVMVRFERELLAASADAATERVVEYRFFPYTRWPCQPEYGLRNIIIPNRGEDGRALAIERVRARNAAAA
jgi:hypothetical protein